MAITPTSNAPSTTTISHLLDPIIESISKYNTSSGQVVPTFKYSDGILVPIKVVPLIADLQANNKVSGVLAHAANMYCSFCLSPQTNIEDLDLNAWEARDSATVWAEAKEWLNTMTQTGQAAQEAISGVWWTSMHCLPYWDPVKHTILGFMHN